MIAHDLLAYHYRNLEIKHRAEINEGVKLAFFATRIYVNRQGGKEFLIELTSDKFGSELVRVHTGR